MELPPKAPLNSSHRLRAMELELSKRMRGSGRHCAVMSAVEFLVEIVGVTSLRRHPTNNC